jgi:hypothetical protein
MQITGIFKPGILGVGILDALGVLFPRFWTLEKVLSSW